MPFDQAERVVEGARHLSPYLGKRMRAAKLMHKSIFLRELLPQDLKIEIERLTEEEAVGPLLTPRIGHRGISIAGFSIVFASLLVAAAALYTGNKAVLPFAAATMLWGHYWDASNCMTIPSLVAKPEYRGTASGFAYVFVKLPSFLAIFLFPALFTAIGQAKATLFVAIFPLIGLLAAIFILPEVYGYEQD
jgi:hypothetical protein